MLVVTRAIAAEESRRVVDFIHVGQVDRHRGRAVGAVGIDGRHGQVEDRRGLVVQRRACWRP